MRSKARAEVIEVEGLVWTAGAPRPVVVASEDRTLFAFAGTEAADAACIVAEFESCLSVRFGFPNDEVMNGHPLWGRGLAFYAAHEVVNSPWLAEMRAVETAHPMAAKQPFAEHRHFLLTYHDSTLEALAHEVVVHRAHASTDDAVAWMTKQIR